VLLTIVILFFSLIRIRLLNFPLERDEGEYAYSGQLVLQGIAPYSLAYNMKLPGTYAAYALIMVAFGESPVGIHAGLLLANAATVILLFLLAKKLFGPLAGLAAGSSYALLSTSESVLGLAGHATHFVVLAALAGIFILLHAIESKRNTLYFLSGLLLGLGFLCKQPGVFFVLFGSLFSIATEWRAGKDSFGLARRLGIYCAGAVIPFALTCLVFVLRRDARQNVVLDFFLWDAVRLSADLLRGVATIFDDGVFCRRARRICLDSRRNRSCRISVGLSHLAARHLPNWLFILLLGRSLSRFLFPSALLHTGASSRLSVRGDCRVLGGAGTIGIPAKRCSDCNSAARSSCGDSRFCRRPERYFFRFSPLTACRAVYGNNPFPEAQVISEYLNQHSSPNARIAVIGSEPEVYFYSRRHSATGYIYTYPLGRTSEVRDGHAEGHGTRNRKQPA